MGVSVGDCFDYFKEGGRPALNMGSHTACYRLTQGDVWGDFSHLAFTVSNRLVSPAADGKEALNGWTDGQQNLH